MLTTNQKGAIAEAAVAKEALELGVGVYRPIADERADFVFDLRPRLLRVQCKWATRLGDVIIIRCRTCRRSRDGLVHRRYEPGEIDSVAAYCPDTNTCYFLPAELSVSRAGVQLRLTPTKNNQAAGIRWASDFEFAARLKPLMGR